MLVLLLHHEAQLQVRPDEKLNWVDATASSNGVQVLSELDELGQSGLRIAVFAQDRLTQRHLLEVVLQVVVI